MLTRLIYIFGLCAVLIGCSSLTAPATPTPQPARIGLKLTPATFGETISVQQHLTIECAGHINQIDAALEIDPHHLELVGIAMGQRVMTLHYDGNSLESWRHPLLPQQLRGEDVLEDVQLTLWPTAAIRQALPAGWQVKDNHKCRVVLFDEMPIIVIDYSRKKRWLGKVVLTNLRYHYRLIIQSVETTP